MINKASHLMEVEEIDEEKRKGNLLTIWTLYAIETRTTTNPWI